MWCLLTAQTFPADTKESDRWSLVYLLTKPSWNWTWTSHFTLLLNMHLLKSSQRRVLVKSQKKMLKPFFCLLNSHLVSMSFVIRLMIVYLRKKHFSLIIKLIFMQQTLLQCGRPQTKATNCADLLTQQPGKHSVPDGSGSPPSEPPVTSVIPSWIQSVCQPIDQPAHTHREDKGL